MLSTPEYSVEVLMPNKDQADVAFRNACAAVLGVEHAKAYAGLRRLRVGGLSIDFRTR